MSSLSWGKPGACIHLILQQRVLPVGSVTDRSICCRMKPAYMGPDSPVKEEFKEFCASNAMDSELSNFFLANCPPLTNAVQMKAHNVRGSYSANVTAMCHTQSPFLGT